MKKVILFVFLLGAMCSYALADFVFEFDENGNGSINISSSGFVNLTGSLMSDPSNGGASALTYLLPAGVVPVANGDVSVYDLGTTDLSDAIRFTDVNGNLSGATADRMIFYSELGGLNWADTGFPSNLGSGATGGPVYEQADGSFFYGAGSNEYYGLSDADVVPEPTSLLLFVTGLGVLGLAAYRRRRK